MSEYNNKLVVNCATGALETVPLTAEEITQRAAERAAAESKQAAEAGAAEVIATAKSTGKATLKSKNGTNMDNIPMPVLSSIVRAVIQELLPEWIDADGVMNVPD